MAMAVLIQFDKDGNYEEAYQKYKTSLDHFMMGLKYEKNAATKEQLLKRVAGYMDRAETLKKV